MTKVNKLYRKWVKNPEYFQVYEELETAFELARTLIDECVAAGLMR